MGSRRKARECALQMLFAADVAEMTADEVVRSYWAELGESRKFDAIICLGTIIRGQTPHFDYIAAEVARGISHAGLTTRLPVVFGIVSADTVDQALDRAGVKLGNKGFEAAMTAVELVNLYKEAFE